MNATATKTISPAKAKSIREQGETRNLFGPVQYGDIPEPVAGTGRATCRCCGRKIGKGAAAWKFHWDFHGCGSWTAMVVQIHRDPAECNPNT